jgi:uncharacterized protein (UPF0335 family)
MTNESNGIAASQLRTIVERIERMHEERKAIADDIKESYAEAKGNGFDVPTIKAVVKARGQDANERMEAEALFDLYMSALSGSHVHVREAAE